MSCAAEFSVLNSEQYFTSVAIKSFTFMALASLQFEKRVIGDHELMQVVRHR